MKILVTGGAGYIGSHTCVELLEVGYEVVSLDNLYNSSEKAVERVKEITGKDMTFYKADILDASALDEIFAREKIDCVIHFAGLKAVGESVAKPLEYYKTTIQALLPRGRLFAAIMLKISYFLPLLLCMEILHLFQSPRNAPRGRRRIPMAGRKVCWSRFLQTCIRRIRIGM